MLVAIGVSESTKFNTVFTGINLVVVLYIVILGSLKSKLSNWQLPESEAAKHNGGKGGFLPFGWKGVVQGAATCFYGFVGFDVIATSAEEARNPRRSIPISIVCSLFIVFLAYFGVSTIQTLMWPYYEQTHQVELPFIFERVGWPVARYFITIGALAGLSTSLFGAMFPLPRVIFSMASDGIIFRFLSKINSRFHTPLIATILSGVFSGSMAAMFDIKQLADMMSIGTLLAYLLVALSVLILR